MVPRNTIRQVSDNENAPASGERRFHVLPHKVREKFHDSNPAHNRLLRCPPVGDASSQSCALPSRSWWRWPSFAGPKAERASSRHPRPCGGGRVAFGGGGVQRKRQKDKNGFYKMKRVDERFEWRSVIRMYRLLLSAQAGGQRVRVYAGVVMYACRSPSNARFRPFSIVLSEIGAMNEYYSSSRADLIVCFCSSLEEF